MYLRVRASSPEAEAFLTGALEGRPVAEQRALVFEPHFPGRLTLLEEDDGAAPCVRAGCATLARDLVLPQARIRAGLIGALATDPDFRGRGLATRILREAEHDLGAQGALVALVWADDPGFLLRRGYLPIGSEIDYAIGPEHVSRLPDTRGVRPAERPDLARLHALYLRNPERVDRSVEESLALLSAPGVEVLVREHMGELCAYSCTRLQGGPREVVGEWSGSPADVLALCHAHQFRSALRGASGEIVLVAPPSAAELAVQLAELAAPARRGALALARLLNPFLAGDLLVELAEGRAKAHASAESGGRITLAGPQGELELDAEEALLALFSSHGRREAILHVELATGLRFPDLPLRPFVWGLDAI